MDEIIEFSQLGEFIDMPFSSYSQGMAARLAFATATSFEPQILLMDEWIGAGDDEFAQQAQSRMDSIVARAGIIVLASHNLDLLRRVCNKALWLKHGRIEEFTTARRCSTTTSGRPAPPCWKRIRPPKPQKRLRPRKTQGPRRQWQRSEGC